MKESASTLTAVVSEEGAHKGYVGVVGGTLRTAGPELLLKPIALAAQAGSMLAQVSLDVPRFSIDLREE